LVISTSRLDEFLARYAREGNWVVAGGLIAREDTGECSLSYAVDESAVAYAELRSPDHMQVRAEGMALVEVVERVVNDGWELVDILPFDPDFAIWHCRLSGPIFQPDGSFPHFINMQVRDFRGLPNLAFSRHREIAAIHELTHSVTRTVNDDDRSYLALSVAEHFANGQSRFGHDGGRPLLEFEIFEVDSEGTQHVIAEHPRRSRPAVSALHRIHALNGVPSTSVGDTARIAVLPPDGDPSTTGYYEDLARRKYRRWLDQPDNRAWLLGVLETALTALDEGSTARVPRPAGDIRTRRQRLRETLRGMNLTDSQRDTFDRFALLGESLGSVATSKGILRSSAARQVEVTVDHLLRRLEAGPAPALAASLLTSVPATI
jgi:hypothetical protein